MTEEPEQIETTEAPSGGGQRGWIGLLLIALLAASGGFAAPYVLNMVTAQEEPGEVRPLSKLNLPRPSGESVYIRFDEIVVNLDEGRLNRYLRLKINLQVDKAQADGISKLLEEKKPILKNWLLSYLSDKGMDDIRGRVGQNRLRREIQEHFNTVLFSDGYDRIHDILFDEFNVQ